VRRISVTIILAALWLALAVPALAKGPLQATITGPNIDSPIVLTGLGEPGAGSNLSDLADATGFWELVLGADSGLDVLKTAPTENLGDPYDVNWHLDDQGGSAVTSVIYPHAEGGAVAYVEPETYIPAIQHYTPGGWFKAREPIAPLFERYGISMESAPPIPAQEPTPTAGEEQARPASDRSTNSRPVEQAISTQAQLPGSTSSTGPLIAWAVVAALATAGAAMVGRRWRIWRISSR
jgi:hypothetical protein